MTLPFIGEYYSSLDAKKYSASILHPFLNKNASKMLKMV